MAIANSNSNSNAKDNTKFDIVFFQKWWRKSQIASNDCVEINLQSCPMLLLFCDSGYKSFGSKIFRGKTMPLHDIMKTCFVFLRSKRFKFCFILQFGICMCNLIFDSQFYLGLLLALEIELALTFLVFLCYFVAIQFFYWQWKWHYHFCCRFSLCCYWCSFKHFPLLSKLIIFGLGWCASCRFSSSQLGALAIFLVYFDHLLTS